MTLAVDIPDLPSALKELIAQIPRGCVTTYGTIAAALGSNSATRWVGGFVLDPKVAAVLPVHRIVRSGGDIGLYYSGDPQEKRRRLQSEGVLIEEGRIDLPHYFFDDFQSPHPLQVLRETQEKLAGQLQLTGPKQFPRTVAGVDLSYLCDSEAIAGYALIDTQTRELITSTTFDAPVTFPYIPTFLAFRELPLLLKLLELVKQQGDTADMIFVDGSGVLHDRQMGIACMLGILTGLPSVGISKKRLCGQVDLENLQMGEARPVLLEGEVMGMALRSSKSTKPIYISPGHLVDVASALQITQQLLAGHRLPEPTFWADKLSRAEVRKRKESL